MTENLTAAAQQQFADELRARTNTFSEERRWLRRKLRALEAITSVADCPCRPCREQRRVRGAILRLLDVVDDTEALRAEWLAYDAGATKAEDDAVRNCGQELAVVIAGEARP